MPPWSGVSRPPSRALALLRRWTPSALLLGLCLADAPAELAAQPTSRGQVVAVESRLATLQAEITSIQTVLSRARESSSLRDCCGAELARIRTAHQEMELENRKLSSQLANSRESSAHAAAREIDAAVRAVQEAAGKVEQARTVADAGPLLRDFADAVFRHKSIAERLNPVDPLLLYLRLVEPVNECTLLVKKVCGDTYDCPDSPGCPVALQLLERYNTVSGDDLEETRFSCLVGLEDPIIFNRCEPPRNDELRAAGVSGWESPAGPRVSCRAGVGPGSTLFRLPGVVAAAQIPLLGGRGASRRGLGFASKRLVPKRVGPSDSVRVSGRPSRLPTSGAH
jgi:hypothetical protein